MTDIIDRLTERIPKLDGNLVSYKIEVGSVLLLEAAAEIVKARNEIAKLQNALREFACTCAKGECSIGISYLHQHLCGKYQARNALESSESVDFNQQSTR